MSDVVTQEPEVKKQKAGLIVLLSFLGFFIAFASVDAYFVFKALSTYTGVTEEHTYEKGLAFNDLLHEAQKQEAMDVQATLKYNAPALQLSLKDKEGAPIKGAIVKTFLVRPVQEGYDFETVLPYKGNGIYEAPLDLPLAGLWRAQIEAQWQKNNKTQTYQTAVTFTRP